jgi:membrane-associated protease RseP (regulator of RpoE activity)
MTDRAVAAPRLHPALWPGPGLAAAAMILWGGVSYSAEAAESDFPRAVIVAAIPPAEVPGAETQGLHSRALDADLAALSDELRARFGIPAGVRGVVLVHVDEGPARDKGLRPGDVIEQVDLTAVSTPAQVNALVELRAGDVEDRPVLMLVNRRGLEFSVGLELDQV